jgi:hypothetical protein
MTKHIIPIPIYNGTLHVFDCKNSKEALKEIYGEDYDESDDGGLSACVTWDHDKNPANWWLCIDLDDSGILVHELFHATHRILEYFKIKFTPKNHEPFAYLMEYLFNECIKLKNK